MAISETMNGIITSILMTASFEDSSTLFHFCPNFEELSTTFPSMATTEAEDHSIFAYGSCALHRFLLANSGNKLNSSSKQSFAT